MKARFKLKHSFYALPTPKTWRKIGDSLLAIASLTAIGGIFQIEQLKEYFTPTEIKYMLGATIAFGAIGKVLTNFFKEDEK